MRDAKSRRFSATDTDERWGQDQDRGALSTRRLRDLPARDLKTEIDWGPRRPTRTTHLTKKRRGRRRVLYESDTHDQGHDNGHTNTHHRASNGPRDDPRTHARGVQSDEKTKTHTKTTHACLSLTSRDPPRDPPPADAIPSLSRVSPSCDGLDQNDGSRPVVSATRVHAMTSRPIIHR